MVESSSQVQIRLVEDQQQRNSNNGDSDHRRTTSITCESGSILRPLLLGFV